jgi:hypothetical protein
MAVSCCCTCPQREEIVRRLVDSLAPAAPSCSRSGRRPSASWCWPRPDAESADLLNLYQDVLVDRVLRAKGNDPTWASRVHAVMLQAGLTDVDTNISRSRGVGGSAGALLIAANIGQLREEFLDAGLTNAQLDDICKLVTDPRIVLRGHFTYSTIGRRTAT